MKSLVTLHYLITQDLSPMITYVNFSSLLILISLVGAIWNKRNFLILLLTFEMLFFSLILNFIYISAFTKNILGQLFSLFIVTVAASETAIGLSLLIISYRLGSKISYDFMVCVKFIQSIFLLAFFKINKNIE